jgi:TRAP-type C4-dicarboxylate transport system substrate-binding protein
MKSMIRAFCLASVVGAGIAAADGVAAQTRLKLSTFVNEVDVRHSGFQKFAELVAEKTQKRVLIDIFPSGTLHGFNESVDAIRGGVTDMSSIQPGEQRMACYRATSLYPAVIKLDRQLELDAEYQSLIKPEATKIGLVPVMNSNFSYDQEWWFKGPIEDLAKLEGKLVRSVGPLTSAMIEAWGGKPVFIAPKELYQSAERGVVNGINMGVATFSSWKLWGVMPYMVKAGLFYGNTIVMMNKAKFDALSPNDQQAILAAGSEAEAWLKPRYEAWIDGQVGAAIMKGGATVVSLSRQRREALVGSVQGKWIKDADAACGPELAQRFRSLIAKHQ